MAAANLRVAAWSEDAALEAADESRGVHAASGGPDAGALWHGQTEDYGVSGAGGIVAPALVAGGPGIGRHGPLPRHVCVAFMLRAGHHRHPKGLRLQSQAHLLQPPPKLRLDPVHAGFADPPVRPGTQGTASHSTRYGVGKSFFANRRFPSVTSGYSHWSLRDLAQY